MIRSLFPVLICIVILGFSCGGSKSNNTPQTTEKSEQKTEISENNNSTSTPNEGEESTSNEINQEGFDLFAENCAECHARMPIRDRDFDSIKNTINSVSPMEGYVEISDEDLQKVLDYLNTL